jgi:hypothetical protein
MTLPLQSRGALDIKEVAIEHKLLVEDQTRLLAFASSYCPGAECLGFHVEMYASRCAGLEDFQLGPFFPSPKAYSETLSNPPDEETKILCATSYI